MAEKKKLKVTDVTVTDIDVASHLISELHKRSIYAGDRYWYTKAWYADDDDLSVEVVHLRCTDNIKKSKPVDFEIRIKKLETPDD